MDAKIGCSMLYTFWGVLDPIRVRGVLNMNSCHLVNQDGMVDRSPSYMLMTVGRQTGLSEVATLIVFVIRSGMEARRFFPKVVSFKKPDTILR